ncbi:type II toxin-antitoxin system PemK/MazF family toxin [Desulfovirgula thermocuniculi]|uniref:type II toxin-antitoxin system PemK/MazF family toxin n=2 Tax=Desulfovirgula thermocuniculi TaxID=348842 RepID=UPI0006890708|nr:type II toxin-antitoxin system PemK/MazF family toxin [Desulfovirgula thermocuniculi]
MTSFSPGDIILVPFPFSNLSGEKKRPALVLAVAERWGELVCVMLTSSPKARSEVPLKQWKEAGLPKPTVARVHRLFTIDERIVIKKLGKAELEDFKEILSSVVAALVRGRI